MNASGIASCAADAQAADAIREHHAQMAGALTLTVAAVLTAVENGSPAEARQAVVDLTTWRERELLPHALFHSHLTKENDLLLPLLESAPAISLAELLQEMHHQLRPADEVAPAPTGHARDCGHGDGSGYPVLDAQAIPHAIRHTTISGALAAVQPGGGLVLLVPHDLLPLLDQVEQAEPGRCDVSCLERGPLTWRLQFARRL